MPPNHPPWQAVTRLALAAVGVAQAAGRSHSRQPLGTLSIDTHCMAPVLLLGSWSLLTAVRCEAKSSWLGRAAASVAEECASGTPRSDAPATLNFRQCISGNTACRVSLHRVISRLDLGYRSNACNTRTCPRSYRTRRAAISMSHHTDTPLGISTWT